MNIPRQLGHYDLKAKLAVGGFCEIWLAHQRGPMGFTRRCVVKLLKQEMIQDEPARRSLASEARLLSRLDHPNLVYLLDMGEHEETGWLYLVMPFISGRTLSTLVNRGRNTAYFGMGEALWIGERLLRGLGSVHELADPQTGALNIVHRDVSPENVMIGFEGSVRLIDFGIAISQMVSRQTSVRRVKGKAQYLSPEQARGEHELDRRSDIFSAGLILFYMLTGQEAFSADMFQALAQARNPRIPPPHEIADVPMEVSKLVSHMLASNLAHRADDAEVLADNLERMRRKFYPEYTEQTFRINVARLLVHERQQDMDFFANLSLGTQVIHAEPTPVREPTQEILQEEIERDLAERTAELTAFNMPPQGRRSTTAEMDGTPFIQPRRDSTVEIEGAMAKVRARASHENTAEFEDLDKHLPGRRRQVTPVELDMTPREPPPGGRRNSTQEIQGDQPSRRLHRRAETKTIPLDQPQRALRREDILLDEETEQPVEDAFNALRDNKK